MKPGEGAKLVFWALACTAASIAVDAAVVNDNWRMFASMALWAIIFTLKSMGESK